jgi:YD repeat-containing protein
VVYETFGGRIVYENKGGVERLYGSDTLGSTAALYDSSGNKTLDNANGALTSYTYDPENRLLGVQSDAGLSTYTYSADGLRRSAIEPGKAPTTMVWDGGDYLQERS